MTVTARHIRRGTQRLFWVATIASTAAPTVAEINAGTDMSGDVRSITGWAIARVAAELPTVDAYGSVLTTAAQPVLEETPTLSMYDEGTGNSALRTTLAADNKGHIVFCLSGAPVATDIASVWPVISFGPVDLIDNEVEAAAFVCAFGLWDLPDERAVIA